MYWKTSKERKKKKKKKKKGKKQKKTEHADDWMGFIHVVREQSQRKVHEKKNLYAERRRKKNDSKFNSFIRGGGVDGSEREREKSAVIVWRNFFFVFNVAVVVYVFLLHSERIKIVCTAFYLASIS